MNGPLIGINDVKHHHGGFAAPPRERSHPIRQIDNHELIMVRSGHLAMFEGSAEFHLAQHEFLYLRPGIEHGGLLDYPSDLSFYWFHFIPTSDLQGLPKTGHFRRPEIATDLASRLLDEQERDDGPSGICDGLLRLLLLESTAIQDEQQQDPSGLVDQAQLFIRRHFLKPISTRDVAEHCGCHPDHLGRVFQARMHISISQAIREHRIRRARNLLRDTKMTIAEIAAEAGFSDAHYFRRCFKSALGSSPAQWRGMHSRQFTN